MRTIRAGSENGRPRKSRSWIKLNIAVFMPMAMASVSTARQLKAGLFRSCRSAKRISFIRRLMRDACYLISFGSHCLDRIDSCRSARRKETGKQRGGGQGYTRTEKGDWIAWTNFVQDLCKNTTSG